MKRIYHRWEFWEDYKAGMWRKETKEYELKNFANIISFTGNYIEYGNAMKLVTENWKYSCEHNLSNISINRKAWLGHAACCFAHGYPEYLVRQAWWELTNEQRFLADNEAIKTIRLWEQKKKSEDTFWNGKADVTMKGYQMRFL